MKRTSNSKIEGESLNKKRNIGEPQNDLNIQQGLIEQPRIMWSALNCKKLGDFQKDLFQYCVDNDESNILLKLRRIDSSYCFKIDQWLLAFIEKQSRQKLDFISFKIIADCSTPKAQFALILYFFVQRYLKLIEPTENLDDVFKISCKTYQNLFKEQLDTFRSMLCSIPGDFSSYIEENEKKKYFSLTIYPCTSTTQEIDDTSAASAYLLTHYLQRCMENNEFIENAGSSQIEAIANFLKKYESFDSITDIIDKFNQKFYTNLIFSHHAWVKRKAMTGFLMFLDQDLINSSLMIKLFQEAIRIMTSQPIQMTAIQQVQEDRFKTVVCQFLTKLVDKKIIDSSSVEALIQQVATFENRNPKPELQNLPPTNLLHQHYNRIMNHQQPVKPQFNFL